MRTGATFGVGVIAQLALSVALGGCYGVLSEDLEDPQEGDPVALDDVFEIPEVDPGAAALPPAPAGDVGDLLVRLQIQPTAWGTEHTFAARDAGRQPHLSLYADGTLIWRTSEGMRIAELSQERAAAVHAAVLRHGLGAIPSYEKDRRPSEGAMCVGAKGPAPCKPGGTLFMADVGIEVWDVAVPGKGTQRSRHYAGWAPGRDADLREVRAELRELTQSAADEANSFEPRAASLLLLATDWNSDADAWPLTPDLFDATTQQHEVVVELQGTDLETMRRHMPNDRRTHFVRDGKLVEATLVPWLPDQDWSADIEGFQPRAR